MVFYDNSSPSPFPTRLHLWLLGLGIEVSLIHKRCHTVHSKIERTHQTMTLQALLGQRWSDQTALWAGLDARRVMLNEHIPSGVLQGRAPLLAYPQAVHSVAPNRPEWEADMLDLARFFASLAQCRFFGGHERTGGSILVVMTTIWGPLFTTRCLNCTSMPINLASLGNPQAMSSPSPLHPKV